MELVHITYAHAISHTYATPTGIHGNVVAESCLVSKIIVTVQDIKSVRGDS